MSRFEYTLTPAYTNEYKSKKEVIAGLEAGHDFQLAGYGADAGRYAQAQELRTAGITEVTVRYKRLTQVTIVDLRKLDFSRKVKGPVNV
jgi:hypothetical protein